MSSSTENKDTEIKRKVVNSYKENAKKILVSRSCISLNSQGHNRPMSSNRYLSIYQNILADLNAKYS